MNSDVNKCPECGAAIPAEAPGGMCPKCLLAGAAAPTEPSSNPQTRPHPPSLEEIAAAFPQLEIIELIGQGGMGFVFRARQPKLDRDVALKILPQHLADDPKFAERFAREGRLLAKLNHPNIVSVYDFGEAGGYYFLLMEYVDGVNLRQAMRASRFTPEQALSIVPSVCEALQFAHDEGVLHRDIKPENILLDTKGRVKIADFGIAKFIAGGDEPSHIPADQQDSPTTLTQAGSSLGTPQYMAPEQIEQTSDIDHRADIYSLGIVFYELLTGELPSGDILPPSSKTPVNPQVDQVVLRALEKERERRQSSATEFRTQVEAATASESEQAQYTSPRWANTLPGERTLSWALGLAMHYSGMVVGVPIVSALGLAGNRMAYLFGLLGIAIVIFLVRSLGFNDPTPTQQQLEARKRWIRSFAIIGTVMCLPVCGFGLFFLFNLTEELLHSPSGWNPATGEAIVVPWSILGLFLLPWSSIHLWRATHASDPRKSIPATPPANPWPRRVFWLIGTIVMVPVLALIATVVMYRVTYGPQTQAADSNSIKFHYRVFEADAELVDDLIPDSQRTMVSPAAAELDSRESPGTSVRNVGDFSVPTQGTVYTESQWAEIHPTTVDALLAGIADESGLLVDSSRTVTEGWWRPGLANTWGYSRANEELFGGGGSAGFLGFRHSGGQDEIRISETVGHNIDLAGGTPMNLNARLFYEGVIPETGALAFLTPFIRSDNSTHYLVVAYEFGVGVEAKPSFAFGPVFERILYERTETSTNWFLDLETGNIINPPTELADSLVRTGLDSLPGSRERQFTDFVNRTGVDLAVYGPESFQSLGGVWIPAHGPTFETWDDLNALTPQQLVDAIQSENEESSWIGSTELAGIGPAHALYRKFSVNYFFQTRDGTLGAMQVVGPDEVTGGLILRYKLLETTEPKLANPVPNRIRQVTDEPFIAYLPDGASVELLAVNLHPSTGRPWWRPDGTPSPYDSSVEVEAGDRVGHGVLALARVDWPDSDESWPRPFGATTNVDTISIGGLRFALQNGVRVPLEDFGVMAFETVINQENKTVLPVKVAVSEWRTVSAQKPGLLAKLAGDSFRRNWEFSETADGSAVVSISNFIQSQNTEYRFVAVDKNGMEHQPSSWTLSTPRNAPATISATFAPQSGGRQEPLILESVREVRLESRPYETVEFRNVSLEPGQRTTVEVKDFGMELTSDVALSPAEETGSVRSAFPKAAHLGKNDASVYLVHDDVSLHYALFYKGDFSSGSRSSGNPATGVWNDDVTLTLPNDRTFAIHREGLYPDELRINGREYNLREGRVFNLRDNGTTEPLDLFPDLATARNVAALNNLVAAATSEEPRVVASGGFYQGTIEIKEFVALYTKASRAGDKAFLESMILREALNPEGRAGAIALLAPENPQNIVSTRIESVEQRLREQPDSFDHLPEGVVPRYIVYVSYRPEVGENYSIDSTNYFPVVEKDGVLYLGAFYSEALSRASHDFGPTIERTIRAAQVSDASNQFLDLDTGELLDVPVAIQRPMSVRFYGFVPKSVNSDGTAVSDTTIGAWASENGADLMFSHSTDFDAMVLWGGIAASGSIHFETVDPKQAIAMIHAREERPRVRDEIDPAPWQLLSADNSDAVAFETREGGLGVLQSLEVINAGRDLRIRYKLLRPTAADAIDGAEREMASRFSREEVITIDSDGSLTVGGEPCSVEDLEACIAKLAARRPTAVFIKVAPNTPVQWFTTVTRACEKAGLRRRVGTLQLEPSEHVSAESDTTSKEDPDLPSAAELEARLEVALQITSFTRRDDALQKVVLAAAEAAEVTVMKRAIRAMTSFTDRDDAASAAMGLLSGIELHDDAIEVAAGMTSFTKKDKALGDASLAAAKSGHGPATISALSRMTSFTKRDNAASAAAQALAEAGLNAEAMKVAQLMTSMTKRDATLKALSE